MTVTSADLDPLLLRRAKELTGAESNRAVIDLALRRLVASRQKTTLVQSIADLDYLPEEIGAPVEHYPVS
jgi:Arc/MetJ family transcription regulator